MSLSQAFRRRQTISINQLYHTWLQQIRQLWPEERITRLRLMAWFLAGIFLSRSVQLHRVAGKIPGSAKQVSVTRRLSRFLDNPAVRVRLWYEPVARSLLRYLADTLGEIRLIADGTRIGGNHQLLMISVALRHRAIPIAWTWVKQARGHSSAWRQCVLLNYVRRLLPAGVPVLLVGDSEFGAVDVVRQVEAWHWWYVLRQTSKELVQVAGQGDWQPFGGLVTQPGTQMWCPCSRFTAKHVHLTNLLAYWQIGEKEPWLLITNLPTAADTVKAYRRRMWTEELFGDLKSHGFDLQSTHLHHADRLSRLMLLAAILYLWLISVGSRAIKAGQRALVDRNDRRDLSIFQIGLRIIERRLTNAQPPWMTLQPC